MHPFLLNHPPITTYGACIVVGLILGWLLARSSARRLALDASRIDLLVPMLVAAGLGGAFLCGGLTDWLVPALPHGTVLLGALLLATCAGIGYALVLRIGLGILGDICAAPVALGIACGRVGCFFAGCCYGRPAPPALPAIRFPQHSFAWDAEVTAGLLSSSATVSLRVHPVQFYESALCLVLAALLVACLSWRRISGECFLLLSIGYALIRFPLEYLRADNPPIFLSLTFSQILCLFLMVLAGVTWLLRRHFADALRLRVPMTAR